MRQVDQPVSKDNIKELRFSRVIWGVISAAFLLASTMLYHLHTYNNPIAKDISENLYVDNLATGTKSTKDAKIYYDETKQIFNDAAMNMCKWVSNDDDVMEYIKCEDRYPEKVVKVLGMIWDANTDVLSFSRRKGTDDIGLVNKRNILRVIASVYDPLGLISPVLLKSKLLLQELWKLKIDWDEEIPTEYKKRWDKYRKDLLLIDEICVKRCINVENYGVNNKHELFTFTDASKDAYAAVVYLKISNERQSYINLVFSKSRIAPIKGKLTIPRLELMGVVIGCRVSNFVAKQLNIETIKQFIFTDSMCAIEWCRTEKMLARFISDRVKEIREGGINIAYVKADENPADIASRGQMAYKLQHNDLWWHGPRWMLDDINQSSKFTYELTEEASKMVATEIRGNKVLHEVSMVSDGSQSVESPGNMKEEKFSSHIKLIRVTAWCCRFINNVKGTKIIKGYLSPKEISEACDRWTRFIQLKHFHDVIDSSESGKNNSIKINLGVYKDKWGILRCGGRFPLESKHPILLPKKCHYTNLIITRYHRKVIHSGVSQTLAAIRDDYWIIQGRSAVRKVIRQCLICIHWEGSPFKTPKMASLPNFIVSAGNPPFTYVGLDYLGPLYVKDEQTAKRKNWVCLFTCLNVRAIHLELVEDMSSNSFLCCMRRFIGRRGTPKLVISDNASQIRSGASVIDKIWMNSTNMEDIQSFVSNKGIQWKYIVDYAPWTGGFYERMVGMTKRALKKSLGKSNANGIELRTLLVEIEAMLNTRP